MSAVERVSDGAPPYPEPITEGATIFTNRVKLLLGLLIIVGALGYLSFVAFRSATVYYYTVGELTEIGPDPDGKAVRVNGKLAHASFHREEGSTLAYFTLTDGSRSMPAVYDGVLPDLFFNEHSEIILEGNYSSEGVFVSHNVIVRCPSKYVAASKG